jgi:hypothetical protein
MNGWLVILRAYGDWQLLDIVPSATKADAMWKLSLHLGARGKVKRHNHYTGQPYYGVDGRHLVLRAKHAKEFGYVQEVTQ